MRGSGFKQRHLAQWESACEIVLQDARIDSRVLASGALRLFEYTVVAGGTWIKTKNACKTLCLLIIHFFPKYFAS